MKLSIYDRYRPFLMINQKMRPKKGGFIGKDWESGDNVIIAESIIIADSISTRQRAEAFIIIDILKKKIIKSQTNLNEDETIDVVHYYVGKYSNELSQAITKWAAKFEVEHELATEITRLIGKKGKSLDHLFD